VGVSHLGADSGVEKLKLGRAEMLRSAHSGSLANLKVLVLLAELNRASPAGSGEPPIDIQLPEASKFPLPP
jgi:hypothetical protein